jgi:hypothetical protein
MFLAEKDAASNAETPTFGSAFFLSSSATTIHHASESPTFGNLLIEFSSPGILFGLLCFAGAFFFLIGRRYQFER